MRFSENFWDQFKNKKTVLYGADATGLAFIYFAQKAGIEIAYFVDRNNEKQNTQIMGKEVKAPFDLLYENPEALKIVVASPGGKDSIIRTLTEMGFERDKHIVVEFAENRFGSDQGRIDAMLGTSRGDHILYEMKEKESDDELLIMTTGGSTTDPLVAGIHSWPYFLQEMIDANGIAARVVNIAEKGYTSSQELLVLLRDGLADKPDIVISYSGWNDVTPAIDIKDGKRYVYTSRNIYITFNRLLDHYRKKEEFPDIYYGRLDNRPYERYITNMRMMHAVCAEFGCKFYGLLQPSLASIPEELILSDFAKYVAGSSLMADMKKRWNTFYEKYRAELAEYSYLYDFSNRLNGHDEVFEDTCHVNEDGNKIIADSVFAFLRGQGMF